MTINELLKILIQRGGSDMHLKQGRPPLFRIGGRLVPTEFGYLSQETLKNLLYQMMHKSQIEKFEKDMELDFSYNVEGLARFRVNAFVQRGYISSVLRVIPLKIPTLDQLRLPPVLKDILAKHNGLILVTGATGSGKSTTLAAMIDHVNTSSSNHIITIEDPIEFVHMDKKSAVSQRELGFDTHNLSEALRHALRQDPDVILIGEMRDPETIATAMTAAETGHLVLSTLHTIDTKQSITRIVDSFIHDQQEQIRKQLAQVLVAIVSQRLCRLAAGNGRIAALEIMINSPTVKRLIEEDDIESIDEAMEKSGSYYRMQSFNQALLALYQQRYITREEALSQSTSPEDLKLRMDMNQGSDPRFSFEKMQ